MKDKTSTMSFTKENFDLLFKEAQSLTDANVNLHAKLAKITSESFNLDKRLKHLISSNEHLKTENENLSE